MGDLESLVAQVWSPEVRPLAEEAWRCYNAGAIRASIAATWTAVTADIITKLVNLADNGDSKAGPLPCRRHRGAGQRHQRGRRSRDAEHRVHIAG
ncbi:hypothetical protein GCM10010404_92690 [Nonomuraea africana]